MRILIACDNFYPNVNGAANFALRLAQVLIKKGHKVAVVCPSQRFRNTVTDLDGIIIFGIRSLKLPKYVYPHGLRLPILSDYQEVKEVMEDFNPQIIHVQDHFMIGKATIAVAKQLNIPILATNHFMPENIVPYLRAPKVVEPTLKNIAWQQFLSVYNQADLVTTPTSKAAKLIRRVGLKPKIFPVSCGIDLDKFNPNNDGTYLLKKYKIPGNKPIILYAGRVDKEKHLHVIIKAMVYILKKCDCHLVISGRGTEKEKLESLAEKLGIQRNITFTGFIKDEDLPNLYTIADVFVMPSIAELQSIVTMEAMASGLPVVGVNVMALPELIHHEENGFLVKEDSYRQFSQRILEIITHPRLKRKMSKKSLQIIKKHEINKIIRVYEDSYSGISNKIDSNTSELSNQFIISKLKSFIHNTLTAY